MGWLELIINIKPSPQEGFKNGAGNGLISEPHSDIFSIMEDEECQILYHKIEKLIAA